MSDDIELTANTFGPFFHDCQAVLSLDEVRHETLPIIFNYHFDIRWRRLEFNFNLFCAAVLFHVVQCFLDNAEDFDSRQGL